MLLAENLARYLGGSNKRRDANPYQQQKGFATQQQTCTVENLPVAGHIPAELNGAFCRVGSNPFPLPSPSIEHHWFDGDGMVQAVRLSNGKAHFSNRWVETCKLAAEQQAGHALFARVAELRGVAGIVHLLADRWRTWSGSRGEHGLGTANTALTFHNNRLLALQEADLPYMLKMACNGVVETVGRILEGELSHAHTAHPKHDPFTGNLHSVSYDVQKAPYCWYSMMDPQGHVVFDVPVPLQQPAMLHDFQLTENHALILEPCLVFDPTVMVSKGWLPFAFTFERNMRIGVVDKQQPRGSREEAPAQWFDLGEPMSLFHTFNAWEEGKDGRTIVLTCPYIPQEWMRAHPDQALEVGTTDYKTCEIRLDLDTGKATKQDLDCPQGEYPKINPLRQGKPCQYGWVGARDVQRSRAQGVPFLWGITKLDFTAPKDRPVAGSLRYPEGFFGGEPYFVPKHTDGSGHEDEGWLLTYAHCEEGPQEGSSELLIYDAATMSEEPLARVSLPQRVPYGFHSLHLNEAQFQAQLSQQPSFERVWPTAGTCRQAA